MIYHITPPLWRSSRHYLFRTILWLDPATITCVCDATKSRLIFRPINLTLLRPHWLFIGWMTCPLCLARYESPRPMQSLYVTVLLHIRSTKSSNLTVFLLVRCLVCCLKVTVAPSISISNTRFRRRNAVWTSGRPAVGWGRKERGLRSPILLKWSDMHDRMMWLHFLSPCPTFNRYYYDHIHH